MAHTPKSLVNHLLEHNADRIRYNTDRSNGELLVSTASSKHFGEQDDDLTITQNPLDLDEHYAELSRNGYQSIIQAAPNNSIILQYRELPHQEAPRTLRLPPKCAAPLYTKGQLERTVAEHDLDELRLGVTRAFLTEHTTEQDGITALRTEVGFSNQAVYQSLQITQPNPPNTSYDEKGSRADQPYQAVKRIDFPHQ